MKELETHLKVGSETRIELNVKKKQEVEYILKGTIKPQNSHFIWELNKETGEIKKAEYKKNTTSYNFNTILKSEELVINENCIYIPSLNAKNAKKKYLKDKEQSSYYVKLAPMSITDITFK